VQNAKEFIPEYENAFDKVICDVPCSGLGVIYKKPDIKYKDFTALMSLPEVQYDILKNVSQYVKKDGELVYSTCTLNEEENTKNVLKFLKNGNFEPVDFEVGNIKSVNGMHTFLPYEDLTDGFFAAKMKRIK
jgi:16S rRNA (cytosine967-C5)-methyltransferase